MHEGVGDLPPHAKQTLTATPTQAPPPGAMRRLKPISTFIPPAVNPSVATFCRLVEQEVTYLFHANRRKGFHSNMSVLERKALIDLSKDNTIVMHNADKGGTEVVQNKEAYRTEILLLQLCNNEFYSPLS